MCYETGRGYTNSTDDGGIHRNHKRPYEGSACQRMSVSLTCGWVQGIQVKEQTEPFPKPEREDLLKEQ